MAKHADLILLGDLHVQRADPTAIFSGCIDYLRSMDLRFGNLEIIPTDVRNPMQGRDESRLISDESNFAAYTYAGLDVVGLANNHSMDQGLAGLMRTIDLLDGVGIRHTGGGRNAAEAHRPALVEHAGARVAFLSYTSVFAPGAGADDYWGGLAVVQARAAYEPHPGAMEAPGTPPITRTWLDPAHLETLRGDIRSAREQADVVIVSWHWGLSPKTGGPGWIPVLDYQREGGHAAIDAGADLVFGHHPHMLQAVEVHRGRPIFYSVGNFAFDFFVGWKDPRLRRAIAVRVAITGGAVTGVWAVPVAIEAGGRPLIAGPDAQAEILGDLKECSRPFDTRFALTPEGIALPQTVPALA